MSQLSHCTAIKDLKIGFKSYSRLFRPFLWVKPFYFDYFIPFDIPIPSYF